MSLADHAWAAGIFSGEGYTTGNGSRTVRLGITNTNTELLERFAAIVKCGRIRSASNKSKLGTKPQFQWLCDDRADAYLALNRLWDWLTEEKREQARNIIRAARIIEHPCLTCGETIPTAGGQKYCSHRCRSKARWQREKRGVI